MLNLCLEKILGNFTRQNLVNDISTLKKKFQIFISYISLMISYKIYRLLQRWTDNNNLN